MEREARQKQSRSSEIVCGRAGRERHSKQSQGKQQSSRAKTVVVELEANRPIRSSSSKGKSRAKAAAGHKLASKETLEPKQPKNAK